MESILFWLASPGHERLPYSVVDIPIQWHSIGENRVSLSQQASIASILVRDGTLCPLHHHSAGIFVNQPLSREPALLTSEEKIEKEGSDVWGTTETSKVRFQKPMWQILLSSLNLSLS